MIEDFAFPNCEEEEEEEKHGAKMKFIRFVKMQQVKRLEMPWSDEFDQEESVVVYPSLNLISTKEERYTDKQSYSLRSLSDFMEQSESFS